MCRSIKPLFNIQPPAGEEEVREAARQYVRKISGYREPSRTNTAAFEAAVDAINAASLALLAALETKTPARPRKSAKHAQYKEGESSR